MQFIAYYGVSTERDVAWDLTRSRQVFVILQAVWPLNLLFDRLTDFRYGSSFRREIAVDRASTVVAAPVAKPKTSNSVVAVGIFTGIGIVVSLWAMIAGTTSDMVDWLF